MGFRTLRLLQESGHSAPLEIVQGPSNRRHIQAQLKSGKAHLEEVVAGHARLSGHAGGHDDHICSLQRLRQLIIAGKALQRRKTADGPANSSAKTHTPCTPDSQMAPCRKPPNVLSFQPRIPKYVMDFISNCLDCDAQLVGGGQKDAAPARGLWH